MCSSPQFAKLGKCALGLHAFKPFGVVLSLLQVDTGDRRTDSGSARDHAGGRQRGAHHRTGVQRDAGAVVQGAHARPG